MSIPHPRQVRVYKILEIFFWKLNQVVIANTSWLGPWYFSFNFSAACKLPSREFWGYTTQPTSLLQLTRFDIHQCGTSLSEKELRRRKYWVAIRIKGIEENIHLVKQKEFVLGEPQVGFELHAVDFCFALNPLAMSKPARLLHQIFSSMFQGIWGHRQISDRFTTPLYVHSKNSFLWLL